MRQFLIMNLFLYVYILLGLFIWITLTNTSLDVPHSTMSNIFHVIYLKALTTCAIENLHVIYSWPSISSDSVNCRSYTTVVHNIKKKNLSISGPAQFKLVDPRINGNICEKIPGLIFQNNNFFILF